MIRFLFFVLMIGTFLSAAEYQKIEINGNKDFFGTTLFDALGIKQSATLLNKKADQNFSSTDPQEIADMLVDFYNSKGYYKCSVGYVLEKDKLIFSILEDKPVLIESFTVSSPIKIKQYITMKVGDIFDADKFSEMKQLVRRKLDESGLPKAKIISSASINLDPYKANVELNITDTNPSKISKIITPQSEDISSSAIRKKLTFKEGDIFDIREIEKSRENLYMTDMFSTVSLDVVDSENINDENITLSIRLDRGKQKSIKISAGYSSDEGPRAKFSWIDKNFFGDFKRVESSLKMMKDTQSADVVFIQPDLYGYQFDDRVSIEEVKYSYLGYREKQISNVFRFEFNLFAAKNFLGLKSEIGQVDAEIPTVYIKSQSYTTNAILYQYLLDNRNSMVDATDGYLIDANIEFANNIFASTLNYIKSEAEGRLIYTFPRTSMFSDLTFALKGKIGLIDDIKRSYIPIFKRFFAGGSFSNRGYSYNRLGPTDNNGNYVGGKTLVDTSSEARYKVTPSLAAVAFFDTTLLSYDSFSFIDKFRPSVGVGIRYETGVGPIRFDIGMPVGENKRVPVYHISFGQSF